MKRLLCLFLLVTVPAIGLANTNINSTNAFSWGANIGFMNWKGDVTNGAVIGEYVLGGFVYGANVGWINLGSYNPANHIQYQNNSATDFGVNFTKITPTIANLRGFAYGASIGWITAPKRAACCGSGLDSSVVGVCFSADGCSCGTSPTIERIQFGAYCVR